MAPARRKNSDRMKRKEETVMKSLCFEQGHSLDDYLTKYRYQRDGGRSREAEIYEDELGDFTLNRKGRTISLLNFARNEDGGFDSTSIKQVITKLKKALVKNECYDTGRQEIHKKIKSGYFDRGARRDKYKAWLTKASVGRTRPNSSQNDREDAKAEWLRPVGKIVTV